MAKEEHLAHLKQGVGHWNRWRRDHPEIQPNLTDTELSHADLNGANLCITRQLHLLRRMGSRTGLGEAC